MKTTRTIIASSLAAAALSVSSVAVFAADCPDGYPSGPVTINVGYGAGGGTDTATRTLAAEIEKSTGWTIVVDNKPGAGGGVMSAALMNAEPDGMTIGAAVTGSVALNPYTSDDTPYTWQDFDYLASSQDIGYGLSALSDKPYSTLEEFVAWAKENGGATVSITGLSQEIAVKQISDHFDVELIPVPGKGAADAMQKALGGHVDATTQGTLQVQQIKAGDMKLLAALTAERAPYAPDTKTLIESGLEAQIDGQVIFFVPKGVDPEIRSCLSEVLDDAVATPAFAELMTKVESEPKNYGPEGITAIIEKAATFYADYLGKN